MTEIEKLKKFRNEKDKHWKNDEHSPLTEEQKEKFRGLNYFPYNPKLNFLLDLDKNIPHVGSEVTIRTTGGEEQIYKRSGTVRFEVGKKKVGAIVFEDPEQEQYQYYLLFRDLTTGKQTYENGRMLQVEKIRGKLLVDFNYAYNPYSSYNDNWDCPITPLENYFPAAIKAGEKIFKT